MSDVPPAVREYLAVRHGAAPGDLQVTPLSGDASTRRYYRVAGSPTGEPAQTTVLALYPESFVAADHPYLEVQQLLAGWDLPVPRVIGVDGTRGVVETEDLGDETLQTALGAATEAARASFYREAIADLVMLQRRAASDRQDSPCFRLAFDVAKLSFELEFFLTHFVCGHRRRAPSAEERAAIAEGFDAVVQPIAAWPRVLCHRDFHSRNLMLHGGRLWWIDFQDARMGPEVYDLVSLLRDSYVELPEQLVQELGEEFRREVARDEDPPEFWRRFDLVALQRNLKALGTFGYQASVRGNAVYLDFVPRTLGYVRANLERHREFDGLRRALAPHIAELG